MSKKQINEIYADMPIHSRLDIALLPTEICDILDKAPGAFLKDIIKDLEIKILNKSLKNNKEAIKKYITINYK